MLIFILLVQLWYYPGYKQVSVKLLFHPRCERDRDINFVPKINFNALLYTVSTFIAISISSSLRLKAKRGRG